jgi:cell division protein FtsN
MDMPVPTMAAATTPAVSRPATEQAAPVISPAPPAPVAPTASAALPPSLPAQKSDPGEKVPVTHPQAKVDTQFKGPSLVNGKSYRIQVGSFVQPQNAVSLFDKLTDKGLNPSYERFENLYRVVLTNVHAENLDTIKTTLSEIGVKEAIVRVE